MAGLDQASRPLRALIVAPEQIYGRILERATAWVVTRREHRAARSDPVWAEMLARNTAAGGWHVMRDDDEIRKDREIARLVYAGWLFDVDRWLERHSLLRCYDRIEARWQRSRRGWADEDLWDFDGYLSRVIVDAVRHLAEFSFGWDQRRWPSHEDWVAELRRLADTLEGVPSPLADDRAVSEDEAEALTDEAFAVLRRLWGDMRLD